MVIERLLVKDMFAYGGVDLDVRGIGPIVAIRGLNGEGKTGLMEIVPAVNWQKLPARENDHPKGYATSRDARLEYWFRVPGRGRFRALLQVDVGSDGVDGLLEQVEDDGRRIPLNDGKVSTLKAAIVDLFPAYDLFINSCFAAQGRGDEFMKTPAAKMKDIFAGFLGLSTLLDHAKTANDAALLAATSRDRLIVLRDELARETDDGIGETLAARTQQLEADIAEASARRHTLDRQIADIEPRLATMQDAVAAHGAATLRITSLTTQLTERRAERTVIEQQRSSAGSTLLHELDDANRRCEDTLHELDTRAANATSAFDGERARLKQQHAAKVADLDKKIAGNEQIREKRDEILAAVAATKTTSAALSDARARLEETRTAHGDTTHALREVEQQLAALRPVEQQHQRAQTDAELLDGVPCHGAGEYAACQFLVNAHAGKAQLRQLAARLEPKAALADDVGRLTRTSDAQAQAIASLRTTITTLESELHALADLAKYQQPLEASDARLTELQQLRAAADEDAATATAEAARRHEHTRADLAEQRARAEHRRHDTIAQAQRRHDEFLAHLDTRTTTLNELIGRLDVDLAAAQEDLRGVADGNIEAADLQARLAMCRDELEERVAAMASAQRGLEDLRRQTAAFEDKRRRLADVRARLGLVETELLEWRSLAKDIGKGGLTDLEIDAAGPTISATANALLAHCMQGRFSLELVTQVAKKDGDMKDDFTVRVMDNEKAPGQWRELRKLSGGQKTIVLEALMCSIALYVNDHASTPMQTFWRDETGAALDQGNALQYVEMLRKVREIGRLDKIFFISHNAAAAELADAQIVVANGTATIVVPPYRSQELVA